MLAVSETVPSPSRIGLDLIAIGKGAPLELDLRVESVSEGVLVTGTVAAATSGECARCLTPVTGDVEIELTELFAYPDSATDETSEADEIGRVVDDTVDLEQPIVDASGWRCPSHRCVVRTVWAVPRMRCAARHRGAGTPPRADRPALGQADNHVGRGRS